jgi:AmiR/NasT family two-component response regulator
MASMLSYRLSVDGGELLGGLNLYSNQLHAFDEEVVATGLLLATSASAVLALNDQTTKSENLTVALQSSREIGIAIDVLMATFKLAREEAFDLLRITSQKRTP